MNSYDAMYLDGAKHILSFGRSKTDRTGTGTISYTGVTSRYQDFITSDIGVYNFPLLTTKKINFNNILSELVWFLAGNTQLRFLHSVENYIWAEWNHKIYNENNPNSNLSLMDFREACKDIYFSEAHGDVGKNYSYQWRNFNGVDQIQKAVDTLKTNPDSRRNIVSAWNPSEVNQTVLPPCHSLFQFLVNDQDLDLILYQRSMDYFLGAPYNIASYSLLLIMFAEYCDLYPNLFVHNSADTHIYKNHIEQIKEQMSRKPLVTPKLRVSNVKSIMDFLLTKPSTDALIDFYPYIKENIVMASYESHSTIKAPVAV